MRLRAFIILIFISGKLWAQDIVIDTDSIYVLGDAQKFSFQTESVRIINKSDSSYAIRIKEIESNRDSLSWERSIQTHLITYPPGTDSTGFTLDPLAEGQLLFTYYPSMVRGCVVEQYEILQIGPRRYVDTLHVESCAESIVSVACDRSSKVWYPNPTIGSIKFNVDASLLGAKYSVVDEMGRVVRNGIFRARQTSIKVSGKDLETYHLYIPSLGTAYSVLVLPAR